MVRNSSGFVLAALALALTVEGAPVSAQTFEACRVPSVGVIYMINVGDAPTACLDASHVQFSWTEGGAPADNSVTSASIVDGTIAAVDIAASAVTTAKLADGSVTAAKLNAAVNLGFTNVVMRLSSPAGTNIPAGSTGTFISVSCLAGEVAVGGSAVNGNGNGVYLKQFYASPLGDGNVPTTWNATYQNTSAASVTAWVYALCAS